MQNWLIGLLPLLVILSFIVTIHELGHFSVARLFKTRVDRFSVGFGKVLFSVRDKNGVEWCLSAIPLGGYVKFSGDDSIASMMPSREELEAARESITAREGAAAVSEYFHFKPLWQRFLIVLAGPASNFVLAIFVFSLTYLTFGNTYVPSVVSVIDAGSPAAEAGFLPGDRVIKVDQRPVRSFEEVLTLVVTHADSDLVFKVERAGTTADLTARIRRQKLQTGNPNQNVTGGYLGVHFAQDMVRERLGPLGAVSQAFKETGDVLGTSVTYLGRIFSGKENGQHLSGPLGMSQVAGDATAELAQVEAPLGEKIVMFVMTYVNLAAYISIGIGFLNLLPIPMLDGGHLLFYLYQGVTKKTISPAIQDMAARVAIVLVLSLMLFAAWNDINHHTGIARFIGGLFS